MGQWSTPARRRTAPMKLPLHAHGHLMAVIADESMLETGRGSRVDCRGASHATSLMVPFVAQYRLP